MNILLYTSFFASWMSEKDREGEEGLREREREGERERDKDKE